MGYLDVIFVLSPNFGLGWVLVVTHGTGQEVYGQMQPQLNLSPCALLHVKVTIVLVRTSNNSISEDNLNYLGMCLIYPEVGINFNCRVSFRIKTSS